MNTIHQLVKFILQTKSVPNPIPTWGDRPPVPAQFPGAQLVSWDTRQPGREVFLMVCDGALSLWPCYDRGILHLIASWSTTPMSDRGSPTVRVVKNPSGWELILASETTTQRREMFPVPITLGAVPVVGSDNPVWTLEKLGAGVWAVLPSLHFQGVIHAYVTIKNVPEPAPWESSPG